MKVPPINQPVTSSGVPPITSAASGWVLMSPKQCLSLGRVDGGHLGDQRGLQRLCEFKGRNGRLELIEGLSMEEGGRG